MKLVSRFFQVLIPVAVVVSESPMAMSCGDREIGARTDGVPDGVAANDWSNIRVAYEAGRHRFFATEDGHSARSPSQQWTARFDGRGFTVRPDSSGWEWGLELVRYGFEGHEHEVARETCASTEGQRLTYDRDAALSEWFVNDTRGLEHGFTVSEMPRGGGTLFIEFAVRGELRPQIHGDARAVNFVDAEGASLLTYAGLAAFDADGKSLPAGFEPAADGLRLVVDTWGAQLPLTIDPIAQQAYLKASNTGAGDGFGGSVSVSGDTVVVGAGAEDSNATGVNGDQSNNSAISAGAVYVFVRSGTGWNQQAYLKASNAEAGDEFGDAVSVSGDTLVVGAPIERSNATGVNGNQSNNSLFAAGAAYVFVRNGTSWSQQAYLKASSILALDFFGGSVSISGDTIVVGAIGKDGGGSSAGGAYVFARSGTTWSQQAYLMASNAGSNDFFGGSVSVSDDTIVISATGEDSSATGVDGNQGDNSVSGSGAAYVFLRSGTTWSQQAYLKASNTETADEFGYSVSVSGDTVVVGADHEDSNASGVNGDPSNNSAPDSGAVYVFLRTGTTWSPQGYLKSSNTGANDQFGHSVSVSGDKLVVAASGEDSDATGVNGFQGNDNASNSGAVYVFTRNGTTWSQQAYLKSSNTEADDVFGRAVSVSGDTVVVGAWAEDSNATGMNGNQLDNSSIDSGAVYIFEVAVPLTYCTAGTTTNGCNASMSASGSPSVTAMSGFVLSASGVEGQTSGLIFYGLSGPIATTWKPGSTSFLCVKSPVQRTASQSSGGTLSGCDGVLTVDFLDFLANNPGALGTPFSSGQVVHTQAWFRDPPAPGTTSLSNGLQFTTAP